MRQISRPLRRLGRRAAHERARRGRERSRAHSHSRQRQRAAAAHQRQRRLPRRAALLSDLRGRGEVGQTGAAASRALTQRSGLPGRDQVEIRDLGHSRLALRDQLHHGAADLLRRDHQAAELEDPDPSPRRDDPVLRRAPRHRLGHARQPHLGRGLQRCVEDAGQAIDAVLQGFLRRHRAVRRAHRNGVWARVLRRRPCAFCVRCAVRRRGRRKLYPRDHEGDRVARHRAGGQGEDLLPQRAAAIQIAIGARALPAFAGSLRSKKEQEAREKAPVHRVLSALICAAYTAVSAVSLASSAHAADKVAVGTGGSASDAPFYIAYDRGFFKDEGLDVDLIVLDSGAKVIAPLGTGELDVGSGALSVGFWNALVRGVKFRIVADRGHTEPGYLYQTVFMRKDLVDSGQFKSLKDLKGLRMGFAAQGVTSLSLLNEAAKYAGIKFEDITPVYLSFPQQIAALQNKALDGTLLIEPQATVAVNAGYGVRFMDANEFYPYQQISVIFYSEKFALQRKDVAGRFMRAWLRGARFYNDAIKGGKIAGAAADEVVAIMAKSFNMNPALI